MRRYPLCQAVPHKRNRLPPKESHRFHEIDADLIGVRRIVPFCDECIEETGVPTSPWTPAILAEYAVQEVMES